MSSRITLLFQALKTFVFIPQSVITFSIMPPSFLSLLQSLLVLFVFLHCGSSLVHTDKLIFSPSLYILFSLITFVVCFVLQLSDRNIENQSASQQRNQITLPTSDGPLVVPQTAFLEIPWVFLHCPADCDSIIYQMRPKFCVFSKGRTGCEGLAHKAWIDEQGGKAGSVPVVVFVTPGPPWGGVPGSVSGTARAAGQGQPVLPGEGQRCCGPGFVWRGGGSASPDNGKHALKEYCSTQPIQERAAVCAATSRNQFHLFVGSRFVSGPVSKTWNLG